MTQSARYPSINTQRHDAEWTLDDRPAGANSGTERTGNTAQSEATWPVEHDHTRERRVASRSIIERPAVSPRWVPRVGDVARTKRLCDVVSYGDNTNCRNMSKDTSRRAGTNQPEVYEDEGRMMSLMDDKHRGSSGGDIRSALTETLRTARPRSSVRVGLELLETWVMDPPKALVPCVFEGRLASHPGQNEELIATQPGRSEASSERPQLEPNKRTHGELDEPVTLVSESRSAEGNAKARPIGRVKPSSEFSYPAPPGRRTAHWLMFVVRSHRTSDSSGRSGSVHDHHSARMSKRRGIDERCRKVAETKDGSRLFRRELRKDRPIVHHTDGPNELRFRPSRGHSGSAWLNNGLLNGDGGVASGIRWTLNRPKYSADAPAPSKEADRCVPLDPIQRAALTEARSQASYDGSQRFARTRSSRVGLHLGEAPLQVLKDDARPTPWGSLLNVTANTVIKFEMGPDPSKTLGVQLAVSQGDSPPER